MSFETGYRSPQMVELIEHRYRRATQAWIDICKSENKPWLDIGTDEGFGLNLLDEEAKAHFFP